MDTRDYKAMNENTRTLTPGYYWVNAFDHWIIAELKEEMNWYTCGNEEKIDDEIKIIGSNIHP